MKTLVLSLVLHVLLRKSASFRPNVGRVSRTRACASSSSTVARTRSHSNSHSHSHTRGCGRSLMMHMGHSHAHHDHAHDDDDDDHGHGTDEVEPLRTVSNLPFSLWGQLLNPRATLLQRRSGKVLLAALIVAIPAFVRKSFTRLDLAAFGVISAVLLVFDGLRFATKKWISKVRACVLVRAGGIDPCRRENGC